MSTKEIIISELESIPDTLLSEVLQLVRSIKHQQQESTVERMNQNLPIEDEFIDPDFGLEVKPEVIEQLLAIRQSKRPTLSSDEVKQRLGLM